MNLDEFKSINKEKFINAVIDYALSGEHVSKRLIGSYEEYSVAKNLKAVNKKLYKGFIKLSDSCVAEYVSKLETGIDDLKLLFMAKTYNYCANFYKVEYDNVVDTMKEFKVFRKQTLKTIPLFFGLTERTEEERQIDYRTGLKVVDENLEHAKEQLETFDSIFKTKLKEGIK